MEPVTLDLVAQMKKNYQGKHHIHRRFYDSIHQENIVIAHSGKFDSENERLTIRYST